MNEAVIVTGASTGIGYASVELLAHKGFAVFAGVRNANDAQRLGALAGVTPLQLDVTDAEQIADAMHAVHESGIPLRALVNNAGVVMGGPLEFLPVDGIRQLFEVNFFGALAATQAFLPMLRQSRGRIVFMSSISGQIASAFVGAYAASKHAMEAAADALRMELHGSGVAVSLIQPGNVNTPIWRKGRAARRALTGERAERALEHYGPRIEALVRMSEEQERTGIDPAIVAQSVFEAIAAKRPRHRYAVGAPPAWMRRFFVSLPSRTRDRLLLRRMGMD